MNLQQITENLGFKYSQLNVSVNQLEHHKQVCTKLAL